MEGKAKLLEVKRDRATGGKILTFLVEHITDEELDGLLNKTLRLIAKIWRTRKTPKQNAYAWELMTNLAYALRTTKEDVYERLLQENPLIATDQKGDPVTITIRSDIDLKYLPGHWTLYYKGEDNKFTAYRLLKGLSAMDTAEANRFIDAIIDECKEQGVPTDTPKQVEELKKLWSQL